MLRSWIQPYLKQELLDWPVACDDDWLTFCVGLCDLQPKKGIIKQLQGGGVGKDLQRSLKTEPLHHCLGLSTLLKSVVVRLTS